MRKFLILLLSLCITTAMAGCGQTQDTAAQSPQQQKADPTQAPKQERVIAGTVALTELLTALKVNLVGVPTSEYTLPKEVEKATRIGNPMKPDLEVIKSLEPTKVISVDTLSEDLKVKFKDSNIEASFVNLNTFGALKTTIKELGETFGKKAEAEELLKGMSGREATVMKKIEGKPGPKVMIIFGAPGSFMIATETSFVGDLAKTLGAKNIMKEAKASFVPVNMEALAKEQPDIILTMTHANPEASAAMFKKEFAENKGWQNFKAVQEGKVYSLDNNYFGMTAALQSIDALEKLANILYP